MILGFSQKNGSLGYFVVNFGSISCVVLRGTVLPLIVYAWCKRRVRYARFSTILLGRMERNEWRTGDSSCLYLSLLRLYFKSNLECSWASGKFSCDV